MAIHPDPPFFYKLSDDTTSDVYNELTIPPPIPDKRIIFGEEETDDIPDHNIDAKKDSIIKELQTLNKSLLSSFIEVLYIIQQSEYCLVELKTGKEQSIIKNANVLSEERMSQFPLMFEPSQLTPLINDKCESLKIIFRSMRDALNSVRPHQAKQTVIRTLQKQLLHKRNKLKLIQENITAGLRICNQKLNMRDRGNEENNAEMDLFLSNSSTDNNHTQESITRLKQTLDRSFFQ